MISRRSLARAVAAASVACLVVATGALSSPSSDATKIALSYVKDNKQELGLTGSDVKEIAVSDAVSSKHNGVTHVYLQQQHRGIGVHNGLLTVNVGRDGVVLSAGNRFVANLAAAAGGQNAKKAAVAAATAAADHLNLKPSKELRVLEKKGGAADRTTISDGGIAEGAIEAELVWLPTDGAVRLAWSVRLDEADHWWNAFVDAETGASLGQVDLIVHEDAKATGQAVAPSSSTASALPSFAPTDNASYRVFPLPFESPSDGDRVLVQNPADPAASPFGWHDTNGVAGPEFTVTRGNNVHAYADRDNNNVPDPGSDPDGGASLVFDFPLDLNTRPLDSQAAFVTNLFYWNNVIHDVMHNYGFDEASGNFQVNNYGKGGLGNDDVRAEAQDGSGRNNANFGTGVEGQRPRMQMFEWRSSAPNPIVVNSGPLAGNTYYGPMAGFGESLTTTGPITGDVVYVGRGCDPLYQAGQPLDPYLEPASGKIALIDRGSCTFAAKVKKAQDQGALMVIVANNIAGPATAMGGADPSITIPSVMVTDVDGATFKSNPGNNVTISDGTGGVPDRDSDLDNGVIAHEYGHGISNRLTGGPARVNCLGNAEQMGEGWSDFFALVLTTSPSDTATTARGVGSYVSFQPADGAGIRPTPYSTDTGVNPSTYASVADTVNISQPHGIGYVWNTMVWEVYWNLVEKYGYNENVYADWHSGGNNLAIQLVTDGLKFQACSPGFVDGRDAILAADRALTGGANQCEIWRGFAKRGLGTGASQGSSNNRSDGVENFDVPATCSATAGAFRPPIKQAPTLNERDAGDTVPVKYSITGLQPGQAVTITSQTVDCSTLKGAAGDAGTPIQTTGSPTQKGNEYHVNWVTEPGWAGTCRRLTLRIDGASSSVAYFRF